MPTPTPPGFAGVRGSRASKKRKLLVEAGRRARAQCYRVAPRQIGQGVSESGE